MSWNYRVIKKDFLGEYVDIPEDQVSFGIHEVYYDDSTGGIVSCTIDPVDPYGESMDELRDCLNKMLLALDKPVLDYNKDIPKGGIFAITDEETEKLINSIDELGGTDAQDGG